MFSLQDRIQYADAIQYPILDMNQLYNNKPTNTIRTAKSWYSGNVLRFYLKGGRL